MRIHPIIYVLVLVVGSLLLPQVRHWAWGKLVNSESIRRPFIRIGMSIPYVRKRVVNQFFQGLT